MVIYLKIMYIFYMRIGLFLNNLDEEYQLSVYKGIKTEASALGIELICVQGESLPPFPPDDPDKVKDSDLFPSRNIIGADGILFLSSVLFGRTNLDYKEQLEKIFANIPFVSLGDHFFNYHSINVISEKPMWDLMGHLITLHKYKKFLFIGGPAEHPDNLVREKIFLEAIDKFKSAYPLLQGTVINGNFLETSGMSITRDYMNQHAYDPPDVIVAANDTMAMGARNMLLSSEDPRWNRCPVTGFDDISQSGLEIPALTTIRQPLDELGKIGVRTILKMIKGEDVPLTLTAEAKLVIRSSCGCPIKLEQKAANIAQYRSIYHLRYFSVLGKSLTSIKTYEEMFEPLNSFLSNLEVPLFYLIIFKEPSPEICQDGKLVFQRTPDKQSFGFNNAPEINIKDFFRELSTVAMTSKIWCMKYLNSGNEYLGLVIYEAPDLIHPQLCNGLILLSNTVKRLFSDLEEMDRSLQLEQEVAFRTKDLLEVNKKLMEEARRRKKIEAEVFRINEMERRRFSMDLYDDICRRLTEVSGFSKSLETEKKHRRQTAALKKLSQNIDETLLRTRRYAHASFPVDLVNIGLKNSLETLCETMGKKAHCKCLLAWKPEDLSPLLRSQEILIYWIIEEALQNAANHANAKQINVEIGFNESWFTAAVQDNGTGNSVLNSGNVKPDENGHMGLGLRSMPYWAEKAGAEYYFNSQNTGGTSVRIRIPLKAQP